MHLFLLWFLHSSLDVKGTTDIWAAYQSLKICLFIQVADLFEKCVGVF